MTQIVSNNAASPSLDLTLHYRLVRNALWFGLIGCIAMALVDFILFSEGWKWKVAASGTLSLYFAVLNFAVFGKIRTLKRLDVLSVFVLAPCYVVCALSVYFDPAHQVTPSYVFLSACGAIMIYRGLTYWTLWFACTALCLFCLQSSDYAAELDYVFLLFLIPSFSLILRSFVNSNYENLLTIYQEREGLVNELSATVEELKAQTTNAEQVRKASLVIEAENLKAEQQRKNYESQLLHSQQLENLGLLAGGVAHDFNNYLAAIVSFSESLLDSVDQDSKAVVKQIKQTALKAAGVAEQMVAQTNKPKEWMVGVKVIELNVVLGEMKQFLRALVPKTIGFELEASPFEVWFEGDELGVQQLVMNLLRNAADATKAVERGRITITISEEYTQQQLPPRFSIGNLLDISRCCQLEIRDNGTGISVDDIQRIFNPQFTTKPEGHGFGMAIANRIVLEHGGAIEVYNNQPTGTCVRIVLPRVAAPNQEVVEVPKEVAADLFDGLVVLLVDDEISVLESVSMLLEAKGHKVIAVPNASDAMSEMEVFHADIDCLILDFSMPITNGLELLNRIRSRGWLHPAILCSGFIMSLDDHPNAQFWPDEFLAKPYKFGQLQAAMDKICRNKTGSLGR